LEIITSIDTQTLNHPAYSLLNLHDKFVRTGDVLNLETKMIDKNGKEIKGLNATYSFYGQSFDGSNSASGLIKENKFVADVSGLYTVNAHFGNITSSTKIKVINRGIKRDIVQQVQVMYLTNTRLMHGFLKELMEKIMVFQEHSLMVKLISGMFLILQILLKQIALKLMQEL